MSNESVQQARVEEERVYEREREEGKKRKIEEDQGKSRISNRLQQHLTQGSRRREETHAKVLCRFSLFFSRPLRYSPPHPPSPTTTDVPSPFFSFPPPLLSLFLSFSISHSLALSFADGLRLVSVFVGATHGPNSPTCHWECMQCSCVFSLALPPEPFSLPPPIMLLRIQVDTPPLCVMRHVFKPDTQRSVVKRARASRGVKSREAARIILFRHL